MTEIAIVLGIIGLILGAIWTVAAAVYQNHKVNQGLLELQMIANNTAILYQGQGSTFVYNTSITGTVNAAGGIPGTWSSQVSGSHIGTPWTGASANTGIRVWELGPGQFVVEFDGLPVDACINLLFQATRCDPSQSPPCPIGYGTDSAYGPTLPDATGWGDLSLSTVQTLCSTANMLGFVYPAL